MEKAVGGLSHKDFIAKYGIAYKEARETSYWLRPLRDTDYIDVPQAASLLTDCEEVLKIIAAIIRTSLDNPDNLIINS